MSNPRVALMGLGVMGSGMARSLLRAGFPVSVYNRDPAKAAPFADAGARIATSPRDAATNAEVIVSMVADDAASRAVWLGVNGALSAARGALLIESSTLTVGWTRELAEEATRHGAELIDAPVTGSRTHAAAGELLFLVGGTASALERARPFLSAMSRGIVHVGPAGSGALLKLVNNFLCGVQAAALAEAIDLIERSGLDRTTSLDVLLDGAPGSPLVKAVAGRMTAREYDPPFFALRLLAKDLTYAQHEAAGHGTTLGTAAAALDLLGRGIADGHGDQDFASVVESLRNR